MNKNSKVYIAGHKGLVGSALLRKISELGITNIILRNSSELDLRNQLAVNSFFENEQPDYVINAAARVGGILANMNSPAEFIYDNMMIAANVIHASYKYNVKKLINLGSSCIYPKLAPQPLKEEYLLSGPLEPTNESYAIAKIASIKLCQFYNQQYSTNFISVMPTNLYGPNDNFDLQSSHVMPAVLRKLDNAKTRRIPSVTLWGDGTPMREFLYVDDLADAIILILKNYNYNDIGALINIGTGNDISIKRLSEIIASIVGYKGSIQWDTSKPNGTPRKVLDVSLMNNLGWHAQTELEKGIRSTYSWYKSAFESIE